MLAALSLLPRFIATPRVTKHRLFVWLSAPTLPDCQLIAFAREGDYFLGVLQSRVHEVWARAQGTQVRERESGFRYTPTSCYDTFPFPFPHEWAAPQPEKYLWSSLRAAHYATGSDHRVEETPPTLRRMDRLDHVQAISQAADHLDRARTLWLNPPGWLREEILEFPGSVGGPWTRFVHDAGRGGIGTIRYPRLVPRDAAAAGQLAQRTLTRLYNERPAWLAHAHRLLDEAVLAAYALDPAITDDALLTHLLDLNLAQAVGVEGPRN